MLNVHPAWVTRSLYKAKPDRAHNLALYTRSVSRRCPWTTCIPQGQSPYKSHLPLLNALERVPVIDWSTDFSQAWALGKEAIVTARLSSPPLTWARLWPTVQCSTSSSFLSRASRTLRLMFAQLECMMAAASRPASRQSPDAPQEVRGHPP